MFTNAILRKPGRNFAQGLTSGLYGQPEFTKALDQHAAYCAALQQCGLVLTILEADERFPDGTFVEDTAILTERCAILTNPGAPSRKGEVTLIRSTISQFYSRLYTIEPPGTLDGGDICQVDDHFLIGLSARTNHSGAQQLADILSRHGYTSSMIDCRKVKSLLHLKSGIAYLGDRKMVVVPALQDHPALDGYQKLVIAPHEAYAANCIRVNDSILIAAGFQQFHRELQHFLKPTRLNILELDVSEFQKMDGGLSCLSLRF